MIFQSHKDPTRGTILDVRQSVQVDKLAQNTRIVAQALASHIYNISYLASPFSDDMVS